MSNFSKDFMSMVQCGHTCGLHTLEEAYFNMCRYYDLYWKIEEAVGKTTALWKEVESVGADLTIKECMGEDWVMAEDKKLEEDLAAMPQPLGLEWDQGEDFGDVADFALGQVCGLEHEECESCQ
jgi:hypothetical protein